MITNGYFAAELAAERSGRLIAEAAALRLARLAGQPKRRADQPGWRPARWLRAARTTLVSQ